MEAVLATIALVLIAGAFVGNLYASRRRASPRVSVYGLIQGRLTEDRPVAPSGDSETASRPGLYATLAERIEGTTGAEDGQSAWEVLAERVDAAEYRPELRSDVEVKTFSLRWGNDYAMIANPTELLHYQLQIGDVPLLPLMDGTRTVRQIVVERFQESGDMELDGVADLVRELRQGNFLTDRFVNLREMVKHAVDPVSRTRAKAREFVKTLSIDWAGAHKLVEWLYRRLLRHFFRPAVAASTTLIAVVGLVAFFATVQSDRFPLGGGSLAIQTFVLLGMDYVLTFIHELGHAVVLVHYGRKVKSAGFMLYF
ncbi:MAG: hypothetical protein ACRDHC_05120, partial [Actinomycetota bacterium]